MFHKGARVNTPRGFGRVIGHHVKDNKLAFYAIEMDDNKGREICLAKDVNLTKESDDLIRKFLSDLPSSNTEQDDEVTKRTCPACGGAGQFENRVETATSYTVVREECFLCLGATVVASEAYAKYARMISKLV